MRDRQSWDLTRATRCRHEVSHEGDMHLLRVPLIQN